MKNKPLSHQYYGEYGGRFVPETLIPALVETEDMFKKCLRDKEFLSTLETEFRQFIGRETPLYEAKRLSELYKARVFLKREDLCHTGAHKINNALGQALMAIRLGKKHVIAETGAGQHGVATATAAAHYGLKCTIFMGTEDMKRQAINVERMRLLGAEVIGVNSGSKTLKDAINDALRYWTLHVKTTHYLFGSVLGPHPFPQIVRTFQSVIGEEARRQILSQTGKLPDKVIACVGGGSNSIGIFSAFLGDSEVELTGVEAGGVGNHVGQHAARFLKPEKGIFQGTFSYVLQHMGQIMTTHSIAAGLDYPSIGPEHAFLHDTGRVNYVSVRDGAAVDAFRRLAQMEGIIPALESSHALGYLHEIKSHLRHKTVIVNLSGRGDKDLSSLESIKKP